MEDLTKVTTYQQYKQAMDTEIHRTTEGFVRIGYLLKLARDNGTILADSGYKDVVEFAQAEYHIDKTQVSRFIRINDRFSEGGNSDRLMDKYQEFGYAKLAIMLQLPDELNEILTPDFSKAEIQTLKEEYDEEQKITDIEVMLEGQDTAQVDMENTMAKVLYQLFKERTDVFENVHRALQYGLDEVLLALAPTGIMLYNVRLQGIGRIAFSIREDEDTADLVNMRSGEMEKVPWSKVMEMLESMINTLQDPEYEWERIYGESFPGKVEVAPVQQTGEKPVQRKESRVVKAKTEEAKPQPVPEPPVAAEPEEQLPGQMDITEFKEVLPEEMLSEMEVIAEEDIEVVEKDETPEVAEEPQTRIPSLAESMSEEEKKKAMAGYKAGITSALHNVPHYMARGNWSKVSDLIMDAKWRVDKIMELEEN
ncbi:MAG: hypothetical protein J6K15_06220 [Lachnospiraceae bacterium]|nr:hypothetical protein [Lachnospiraceae bacterium]